MLSECDANDECQQLLNGYLGVVISETLRLYHPVAWYARKTVRQAIVTDSKGASHAIPANTIIMINVAAMGRHGSPSTALAIKELWGRETSQFTSPGF